MAVPIYLMFLSGLAHFDRFVRGQVADDKSPSVFQFFYNYQDIYAQILKSLNKLAVSALMSDVDGPLRHCTLQVGLAAARSIAHSVVTCKTYQNT